MTTDMMIALEGHTDLYHEDFGLERHKSEETTCMSLHGCKAIWFFFKYGDIFLLFHDFRLQEHVLA